MRAPGARQGRYHPQEEQVAGRYAGSAGELAAQGGVGGYQPVAGGARAADVHAAAPQVRGVRRERDVPSRVFGTSPRCQEPVTKET